MPSGSVWQPWSKARWYQHPLSAPSLVTRRDEPACEQERKSERKRERKRGGGAKERASRRAAVEPARRRSNRQTRSSLSFSHAFSPSSSFRLYLSSCCFPSRTGPAVPETASRRVKTTYVCLTEAPGSRSRLGASFLLLTEIWLPLTPSSSISRRGPVSLARAQLDLWSTRPLNVSYTLHTMYNDKILYSQSKVYFILFYFILDAHYNTVLTIMHS